MSAKEPIRSHPEPGQGVDPKIAAGIKQAASPRSESPRFQTQDRLPKPPHFQGNESEPTESRRVDPEGVAALKQSIEEGIFPNQAEKAGVSAKHALLTPLEQAEQELERQVSRINSGQTTIENNPDLEAAKKAVAVAQLQTRVVELGRPYNVVSEPRRPVVASFEHSEIEDEPWGDGPWAERSREDSGGQIATETSIQIALILENDIYSGTITPENLIQRLQVYPEDLGEKVREHVYDAIFDRLHHGREYVITGLGQEVLKRLEVFWGNPQVRSEYAKLLRQEKASGLWLSGAQGSWLEEYEAEQAQANPAQATTPGAFEEKADESGVSEKAKKARDRLVVLDEGIKGEKAKDPSYKKHVPPQVRAELAQLIRDTGEESPVLISILDNLTPDSRTEIEELLGRTPTEPAGAAQPGPGVVAREEPQISSQEARNYFPGDNEVDHWLDQQQSYQPNPNLRTFYQALAINHLTPELFQDSKLNNEGSAALLTSFGAALASVLFNLSRDLEFSKEKIAYLRSWAQVTDVRLGAAGEIFNQADLFSSPQYLNAFLSGENRDLSNYPDLLRDIAGDLGPEVASLAAKYIRAQKETERTRRRLKNRFRLERIGGIKDEWEKWLQDYDARMVEEEAQSAEPAIVEGVTANQIQRREKFNNNLRSIWVMPSFSNPVIVTKFAEDLIIDARSLLEHGSGASSMNTDARNILVLPSVSPLRGEVGVKIYEAILAADQAEDIPTIQSFMRTAQFLGLASIPEYRKQLDSILKAYPEIMIDFDQTGGTS